MSCRSYGHNRQNPRQTRCAARDFFVRCVWPVVVLGPRRGGGGANTELFPTTTTCYRHYAQSPSPAVSVGSLSLAVTEDEEEEEGANKILLIEFRMAECRPRAAVPSKLRSAARSRLGRAAIKNATAQVQLSFFDRGRLLSPLRVELRPFFGRLIVSAGPVV